MGAEHAASKYTISTKKKHSPSISKQVQVKEGECEAQGHRDPFSTKVAALTNLYMVIVGRAGSISLKHCRDSHLR